MKKVFGYLWHVGSEGNPAYLLLRVFTGLAMLTHGWPKLMAGPKGWEGIGGVMEKIGIPGPAVFWGFMAAFSESIGAILLTVGLLAPMAAFLIGVTMAMAAFVWHAGDPFAKREMALLYLCICVLFMLKGAGRYSLDRLLPSQHV